MMIRKFLRMSWRWKASIILWVVLRPIGLTAFIVQDVVDGEIVRSSTRLRIGRAW